MSYEFASRMAGLKASAIREILKFTADPTVISFAAGNPAPEAFPSKAVAEISTKMYEQNPIGALQYSISEGYTPLRNTLKADLKARHNIGREGDDLIITTGAQQAIEISCKVMCNAHDTIICEEPSFIGSLNSFRSYEANLVGVPVEADGISIEGLRDALDNNPNTKLVYLIPNFQNPTGITMSLEKRKACYELCRDRGVLILEDNPYGELRFAGNDVPSIKSMDEAGIVIYCGTFSKVLAPGLRVGYVCANSEVIQKMLVCKQASDVHTNISAQIICNEFMDKYDFAAHIKSLQAIYRNKCNLMLDCLTKHLNPKIKFTHPDGGLFIWCTLPDGVDMMDFCKRAVLNKVAVVPGTAFLPDEMATTQSFRLNFSTPTDEQIIKGVELLGELTHDMM